MQNAAELVVKIMKGESIPISNVVQHNYFSGKNCPRNIRAGKISWSNFLKLIQNASLGNIQQPKPTIDVAKYRVMTGTYSTRQAAENVIDVLNIVSVGWLMLSKMVSYGVLKQGRLQVQQPPKMPKIKAAGLAKVANIVAE